MGLGWDLCQRSYTSAKKDPLNALPGLDRRGLQRQQDCGRDAEGGGDRDEVVDVTAAVGALGAAEGCVTHRAAQRGASGSQLVLGQAARDAYSLYGAGGVEAGGAYFNGSSCHDR
nr:hypothetical protein StreXyl84_27670 [Streptomyces sp. Xyl84]